MSESNPAGPSLIDLTYVYERLAPEQRDHFSNAFSSRPPRGGEAMVKVRSKATKLTAGERWGITPSANWPGRGA
jgi:hypothetical protein